MVHCVDRGRWYTMVIPYDLIQGQKVVDNSLIKNSLVKLVSNFSYTTFCCWETVLVKLKMLVSCPSLVVSDVTATNDKNAPSQTSVDDDEKRSLGLGRVLEEWTPLRIYGAGSLHNGLFCCHITDSIEALKFCKLKNIHNLLTFHVAESLLLMISQSEFVHV